jgi:hypothetical protein
LGLFAVVSFFSRRFGQQAVAQQSVHPTLGILAKSQSFFYASAFFQLDGFAVRPPQRG